MSDQRGKHESERSAEEAASWVARLQSSDATDEDRSQFGEWLKRDPSHQGLFDDFRRLWGELKDVPVPPDRLENLRGARRRAGLVRSVGIAVFAFACIALYQLGYLDRMRADHYTSVGEVRRIVLDDGTRVDLNTDTAIAIDYSDKARRVRVLRGEAFFDVARNPGRPFTVEAGMLSAMAVGTQYGLRAASGGFRGDVQVEEGKVEVRAGREQVVVGAGNAATLTERGHVAVQPFDVGGATAWRDGKLVFSERPLREVLAALERYRHGRIVIMDNRAAEQQVSGIFDVKDTEMALREIETSLPVTVTRVTGLMVVVRSRQP